MKENKLLNLAQEFAVEIIAVANVLRNKKEHSISDQIKRSGTSISANIAEESITPAANASTTSEKRCVIFLKVNPSIAPSTVAPPTPSAHSKTICIFLKKLPSLISMKPKFSRRCMKQLGTKISTSPFSTK